MRTLQAIRNEDDGVLSFEWVLLVTLLVIGIVAGASGVRDAFIDELGDSAGAIVSFDQSFTMEGVFNIPDSSYTDQPVTVTTCERATNP